MNRLLTLFAAVLVTAPTAGFATDLKVTVQGVHSTDGYVMVALCDSEAGFDEDTRLVATQVKARRGQLTVAFLNLPPGTYAVSTFHDENGNGKLDKKLFGIPTEGYGFSNNAKGFAGPPTFDGAAIAIVGGEHKVIGIDLSY